MTFVVFSRRTLRGRRWFWHLKAGNHEIVASGQSVGYANRVDVFTILGKMRESVPGAQLVTLP